MTRRGEEEWFDVRGAARRSGRSADTIRRRLREGEFARARRGEESNAPWQIPMGDLVAAGLIRPLTPSLAEPDIGADSASDSAAIVRHLAVLEELAAVMQRQIRNLHQQLERNQQPNA